MPITSNNRYTAPDWTTQKINATELNAIDGTVEDITTPVGQIILSRIDPGSQYIPCDGSAADLTTYPELADVDLVEVADPSGAWAAGVAPNSQATRTTNSLVYNNGCWLCVNNEFESNSDYTHYINSYRAYYTTSLTGSWTQAFRVYAQNVDTGNGWACRTTDAKCLNGYWVVTGYGYRMNDLNFIQGKISYSLADTTSGVPTAWTQGTWGSYRSTASVNYDYFVSGVEYDSTRGLWQLAGFRAPQISTSTENRPPTPFLLTGSGAAPSNISAATISGNNMVTGGIKAYNGTTVMVAYTQSSFPQGRYIKTVNLVGSPVAFVINGETPTEISLGTNSAYTAQWDMVECYKGTWVIAPNYVPAGNTVGIFVSTNPARNWTYISAPFGTSSAATYWHSLKCIDGWWMIGDNYGNIYTTQDPTGVWEQTTVLSSAQISNGAAVVAIGGYEHSNSTDGLIAVAGSRPIGKNTTSATPSIWYTTESVKATPNITTMFGVNLPADTSAYIKAVSDTAYTAQTWRNSNSPYISAANLTTMTGRVSEKQAEHGDIRLFVKQAPAATEATWVETMPVPPDELGVAFCTLAEDKEVD